MRSFSVGSGDGRRRFNLVDPDGGSEADFTAVVAKALTRMYQDYHCFVFGGTFAYDDTRHRPDLALVARDLSHWFVIEVELVAHSFETHVLPQVKAFRYGRPQEDCAGSIATSMCIERDQARTLLTLVPRGVAVIINKRDRLWEVALRAHDIQLAVVSAFIADDGSEAIEIDGTLEVVKESLGFGQYSATDRALRFPLSLSLPSGPLQIRDPEGGLSWWKASPGPEALWLQKEGGFPDFANNTYVQLIRSLGGSLSFRRPAE